MKKVLAIASGGGHWVQLCRLRDAFEGTDIAFASVFPSYADDVAGSRFHVIPNVSRFDKFKVPLVVWRIFRILLRERPSVVITTGAAPGLIALALAKYVFRAKTIWIDSIANCEQLSSSGNSAQMFADLWLTQWPHLASEKGPEYWGAVL